MKYLFVLFVVVAAALGEQYTNKYDNINLEEIMGNPRLVEPYCKCMLDKGKCTPEGSELKEHISEGLETGCEKCTDKQKDGVKFVTQRLIKDYLECWKSLTEKYDSTGKWAKHYENLAKENGIEIPQ